MLDNTRQLYFHQPTGVKSLSFESVTFVDIEKIIFESYPDIENDDEVNFGGVVRINFNSKNDDLTSRTLDKLKIKGITCFSNQNCMIARGNATSCDQDMRVSTFTPPTTEKTEPTTPAPTTHGTNSSASSTQCIKLIIVLLSVSTWYF